MNKKAIIELLQAQGLVLLGSFLATADDKVPEVRPGHAGHSVLMIGNGGSSFWKVFSHAPEYSDGRPDPLDRWSRRIGEHIAAELGGRVIFPFGGPPYTPFQSWAKKTGEVAASKISMVMHTNFGLWHAYRFAIVLTESPWVIDTGAEFKSPCIDCIDQPCLTSCPVEAFNGESYALGQCVDYLAKDSKSECRTRGCKARRSCPVGRESTYEPDHARYHMDAFVRSQRP